MGHRRGSGDRRAGRGCECGDHGGGQGCDRARGERPGEADAVHVITATLLAAYTPGS